MQIYGFDPKEYTEKKEIRRAANCIGAAYALMFVFVFVLELGLIAAGLFSGMGMDSVLSLFEDGVVSWLLQAVMSTVMFTLPYILAAKLGGRRLSVLINTKKPQKGRFLPLVAMGVGICQIGEIMTNIFASVLSSFGMAPSMPSMEYDTSVWGVVLGFAATAVIPALVEEFALRGVVQGMLRPFGEGFAIVVSAIVFGLMHGNLVQAPFAFVVGLGLGFIMVKSGSIWTAVTVHFINNAMAVGFEYLTMPMTEKMQSAVYYTYAIFMLLVGVTGFIAAAARDKELWTLEPADTVLSNRKKAAAVFSSPFMIIALVITAIEMLLVQVMY